MGVMTRDRGEVFVITSDRIGEVKNTRAAKNLSSTYLVWTGDSWSPTMTDAKTFATSDEADEYIRANSARVMLDGCHIPPPSARSPLLLSLRIPHRQLSPAALLAVVEEFVTRDGTDHWSVECRIEAVLQHLKAGRVELHFDDETQTCNIVPV